jgi:hypothetical protein
MAPLLRTHIDEHPVAEKANIRIVRVELSFGIQPDEPAIGGDQEVGVALADSSPNATVDVSWWWVCSGECPYASSSHAKENSVGRSLRAMWSLVMPRSSRESGSKASISGCAFCSHGQTADLRFLVSSERALRAPWRICGKISQAPRQRGRLRR